VAEQNGEKTIKIKLVRSPIGYTHRHKDTVRALGFNRMHQVLEKPDNEAIRGMIDSVRFMVQVL